MTPAITPSQIEIRAVHPESPEAQHCLQRYYAELDMRFEGGFDPTLSIAAPPTNLIPPKGIFLVCFADGRPIGSGAVTLGSGDIASIKRMWVDEEARGLGIGRKILAALEEHAGPLGARTLRLETNRTLTEAIRLYRSAGYEEVDAFNDDPYAWHWFEKHLGP